MIFMKPYLNLAGSNKKPAIGIGGLLLFLIMVHVVYTANGTDTSGGDTNNLLNEKSSETVMYPHLTTNDSLEHVVNHPAFKGFGRFLLPREHDRNGYDRPLYDVRSVLPYHGHVDPDVIVGAINHMIDEVNRGKTIFYDFYTERQKQENPIRESTGLFFFKGKPGAPFAILCPGGGFTYVGSLHEGFPHAVELCKKGYNTFVLPS